MHRALAFAALAGLALSLIVHVAALSGVDIAAQFPFVWGLHVGVFAVFVPFVLASRKELGGRPSLHRVLAIIPPLVALVAVAFFAYAIINFVIFLIKTESGTPSMQDGRYVLMNHGRLIREITSIEYKAFKANEIRGFSGHWILFYYLPFAYFMFGKRAQAPGAATTP